MTISRTAFVEIWADSSVIPYFFAIPVINLKRLLPLYLRKNFKALGAVAVKSA
jgi:hypothetical protein